MSIKADDVQDGDLFFVDPSLIEVDEDLPGRQDPPAEEVVDMAISLHTHGQRRAVECRRFGVNRFLLVHGFVRTAAARLIRTGFKYTDPETNTEVKVKDKRFKVWVVLLNASEQQASQHEPSQAST
jgi:hypothetical protein